MKKIISLLALSISALASGLFSTSAYAAPVTSDVQINVSVPDIVFLTTYDKITFNLNATDLTTATINSGTNGVLDKTAGSGTVAGVASPVSPLLTPAASTTATNITYPQVILYKTWGLGDSTKTSQIQHGISTVTSSTLTGGTGSTINMISPTAALNNIAPPGLDPGGAIDGKFDFTFDLSNVKNSGTHTGGVVTVSAEGV
jgi:hypothetical protein